MKILTSSVKSSITIKKSKFLCFAYFIKNKEEAKKIVNEIKKEYPDASHVCYAYVLDDKTFYYTDGGEPSNTAGTSIYGAIVANHLNYTLVVVVRYFGGIKFGPGPLRSTFKDIASNLLENALSRPCYISDVVVAEITYDKIKKITTQLKSNIRKQEFKKEYVIITFTGNKTEILKYLTLSKIKPISIKENQVV